MTTVQAEKIARNRLSLLLELAQERGNVSKACRIGGCSRQRLSCGYGSASFTTPSDRGCCSLPTQPPEAADGMT